MSLSEHDAQADELRRETFKPTPDRPGDPNMAAAVAALTGEILSEDRVAVEFIQIGRAHV